MRNYYGNESGDGVGNRRSSKEIKIQYDGVGNQLSSHERSNFAPDNIGNSVDTAPTHHLNSASRKKTDQAPPQRMGRYLVGGVNPLVAGLAHLIPETPTPTAPQENKTSQGGQAQADKRLRRLFEFDDDDRVEYTLTSTPEEKRAQLEQALKTIFELGGAPCEIKVQLEELGGKPLVSAQVQTTLFKPEELPFAALSFLTNKIVNRVPTDRIRLAVKL